MKVNLIPDMPLWKPPGRSFASLFSVVKDNSSVFLLLEPCIFWTKGAH